MARPADHQQDAALIRSQLTEILSRSGLPRTLTSRLLDDAYGEHYRRVLDVDHLDARPGNSSYWGATCACCCCDGTMVPQGQLGMLKSHDSFAFLKPGYHTISSCGEELLGLASTSTTNKAVTNGSAGFVVVTEGNIGVLLVESTYKLLAPGVYEWNSPSVTFNSSVNVTGEVAKLGPFTLVTVPDGLAAITYENGDLRVLGWHSPEQLLQQSKLGSAAAASAAGAAASASSRSSNSNNKDHDAAETSRTFFLSDPKHVFDGFLSLKEQTDKLEGNDLLSRDNVEILMVAMSQWRIVDPYRAVKFGADDMEKIRARVNALIRATIARIVAGTNIGAGGGGTGATAGHHHGGGHHGGSMPHHDSTEHQEADLAHLMQSDQATAHMKDLSSLLVPMGVVVASIFVPERRLKNDDMRQEIARQAVIGIKAEAERSAADARAYAIITHARAEAEAIAEVARAHSEAGKLLGEPTATAARLALSEVTAKALQQANVTIFSGAPDSMPFMLTAPSASAAGGR